MQRPNYFYISFAVAAGLMVLFFALGPYKVALGLLAFVIFLAGIVLFVYYKSMNQDGF